MMSSPSTTFSLDDFSTRDPNEFLRPPENQRLLSVEPQGSFLVLKYYADTEDNRMSAVTIYLNDHGQEVIRSVRLSQDVQPHYGLVIKPEPLAWCEKVWLYVSTWGFGQ